MPGVSFVGVPGRLVVSGIADMGWDEFAAAVVTAVDHALPDGFKRDFRFIIVNGRAAGDIIHVGVMNARERR